MLQTDSITNHRDLQSNEIKNSGSIPRKLKYNWANPGSLGEFLWIDKKDLSIDKSYQRDQITAEKVKEIARKWDWKLIGALSVVMRKDNTFWIFDGGHRYRASLLRNDITVLPCMVFEVSHLKDEAKAFVGANTMLSIVQAYDLHRAAIIAQEPLAMATQALVEKHGYKIMNNAKSEFGFCAINSLKKLIKINPALSDRVFAACAHIAKGEQFSGEVLKGLFYCAYRVKQADILQGVYLEKLMKATITGITMAIRRERHILGKGGELIAAKAILDLLNKGLKRRLAFSTDEQDE